jgi:predicted lipoprotein
MTTTTPSRTVPVWRHPRVIGAAVTVVVIGAAIADTTFVAAGSQAAAADTAVEYVELNFDSVVVPAITENAQPLPDLVDALLADPDAAGEEFGTREDETKPYSFATTATGTLTEGRFGEVGLEVPGVGSEVTVGVAIPPLGSATAIRDAGTDLTFGDFVNQTEYQNVAIELNTRIVETVYADLDLPSMIGQDVTVTGAFTWVSNTGGPVDHVTIVPVDIEDAS